MSKESERIVKYCVYCGAKIDEGKIYCPNCGKLVLKIDSEKAQIKPKDQTKLTIIDKMQISRKCPGCGSIITSNILEQCPICDATLEKISEQEKYPIQKKPGLIFTNKKFQLEQQFILKKDTWNLREGINVFSTCLYILILIFFLIYMMILIFQPNMIIQIITSQIPEALFAAYPLWYIYSKNHSYKKLGLIPGSKKIIYGFLIGISGGLFIFLINYLFGYIINFIADLGLDFFDIVSKMELQNASIHNADLIWIILLIPLLSLAALSIEIVFRGVLHNALKERIKNEIYVILLIALIYSVIMIILTFPIGIYYFFMNFLIFVVLGILYEINGNLFNSIIGHIFYNLLILSLIIFLG